MERFIRDFRLGISSRLTRVKVSAHTEARVTRLASIDTRQKGESGRARVGNSRRYAVLRSLDIRAAFELLRLLGPLVAASISRAFEAYVLASENSGGSICMSNGGFC